MRFSIHIHTSITTLSSSTIEQRDWPRIIIKKLAIPVDITAKPIKNVQTIIYSIRSSMLFYHRNKYSVAHVMPFTLSISNRLPGSIRNWVLVSDFRLPFFFFFFDSLSRVCFPFFNNIIYIIVGVCTIRQSMIRKWQKRAIKLKIAHQTRWKRSNHNKMIYMNVEQLQF